MTFNLVSHSMELAKFLVDALICTQAKGTSELNTSILNGYTGLLPPIGWSARLKVESMPFNLHVNRWVLKTRLQQSS